MTLKLHIEYVLGSSNTLMAKAFYEGACIVEFGATFEEAKRNVIETAKKRAKILTALPQPETITIDI